MTCRGAVPAVIGGEAASEFSGMINYFGAAMDGWAKAGGGLWAAE